METLLRGTRIGSGNPDRKRRLRRQIHIWKHMATVFFALAWEDSANVGGHTYRFMVWRYVSARESWRIDLIGLEASALMINDGCA